MTSIFIIIETKSAQSKIFHRRGEGDSELIIGGNASLWRMGFAATSFSRSIWLALFDYLSIRRLDWII